jgi:CxxC-x17-CxxC domain-containing protein
VSYADKALACRDCGQAFVFTTGEQEFFAQKGFTNEPSRCPDCRRAHKAERSGTSGGYGSDYASSSGGYSGGYDRGPRELFSATCSTCGNEARVPFQPRGDKPVYCTDCFSSQRSGSGGGYGGGSGYP